MTKIGFIAITGRPNAGKSSLINAIVGEKVSIVSPKPQTTRGRAYGILTENDAQMVLIDTPGVFNPRTMLDTFMEKDIKSAASSADAIVWVIDCTKPFTEAEEKHLRKLLRYNVPLYIGLNKIDLGGYEKSYALIDRLKQYMKQEGGADSGNADTRNGIKDIVPISCKTKQNIDILKGLLFGELKEGAFIYDSDDYTDKSVRFIVAEIIRERVLLYLQQEIPHGAGIIIQSFDESGDTVKIEADLVLEKASHKKIVIGAQGEMLKQISVTARKEIEKLLNKNVYLRIFVKVRPDWRDRADFLSDLGYKN